ncbi:hypothetical protein MBLNU230_g2141t1 [Neophaeotheca triangularis]
MVVFKSLFAVLSLLLQHIVASPVAIPEVEIVANSLTKRSIGGPKLGGVNFPDPSIIKVGNAWYAFATRTKGSSVHIQVAKSTDFERWTLIKDPAGNQYDALPDLRQAPWVYQENPGTWAPDVNRLADGTFVMYYSARVNSDNSKHCIGAATSTSVLGPYIPQGDKPLLCPLARGGAIDASGFKDSNGQRYIAYKADGNALSSGGPCNAVAPYKPTPLILQPVAADGITLTGSPTTLLDNSGAPDQGIVEAPSIGKFGDTYVLFFSSGCFATGGYTVNYATSSSVTGPYRRAARPLFQTGDYGLKAPGGMDIAADGGDHLLFHANNNGVRSLYQAVISVKGNVVTA